MAKGEKTTKTEFVWALVKLAETDRDAYRKLRELGWKRVEETGSVDEKSELPN